MSNLTLVYGTKIKCVKNGKGKGKVVPVQATKAGWGSIGIVPLIFNLFTR
jgi:hypothetical protein